MPARFLAQRQQQLACLAQGQLGGGLHFQDARVGTQQQIVVDQLAEALLFTEQFEQHLLDTAHALFEGAIGGDQLDHRLDVLVPGRQYFGVALAQRNLPVAGLGSLGHAHQRLLVVAELLENVPDAHIEQAQLAGQVVAITDFKRVLDIAGQTLQMAQVGFDLQAQPQAMFAAQVGEEVVDLRVQLEAVGALGHRHQDIQANPLVEQGGDIGWAALGQLRAELVAQLDQAQGAGIEAFAQGFE